MKPDLTATNEELLEKFKNLRIPQDVADLLEVPIKTLTYFLYGQSSLKKYKTFYIPKKSGGTRQITAPASSIKILQRKVNHVLRLIYKPKPPAHGFCVDKSVLTNAKCHVKKTVVLNLDLKDFFPTINFGRVRGMFMARPYNVPEKAATVLSQICCHENTLPQGAPTSPIVSNMICGQMDSQLMSLAKSTHCTYTRYADDITFSTTTKMLNRKIAKAVVTEEGIEVEIDRKLKGLIEDNGFEINNDKVHFLTRRNRQIVTGLTVNEFPNVTRRYIKQIRAMLHAWDKYGLESAQQEYWERYSGNKFREPERRKPSFMRVVEGKLSYLKMIRGEESNVYRRLAYQFDLLTETTPPLRPYAKTEKEVHSLLWVLTGSEEAYNEKKERDDKIEQGTAFFLEGVGLVTCEHVLLSDTKAYQPLKPSEKYPVSVIARNKTIDLAILRADIPEPLVELKVGVPEDVKQKDPIKVFGFPNHQVGDRTANLSEGSITGMRDVSRACSLFPNVSEGCVTCERNISTLRHLLVGSGASIIKGGSGGPVLNEKMEVIGIAGRGPYMRDARETEDHAMIPITALEHLINP